MLTDYGDGAGGLLWSSAMRTTSSPPHIYGDGHYVAWRVIGSKLYILESQPRTEGIVWTDFYDGIGRNMDPASIAWSRLDGLEPVPEVIKKFTKNA